MKEKEKKRVLVIGGSGYLGQHLLLHLSDLPVAVAFTHHSSSLPHFPNATPFQLDLQTGQGFHSIARNFGQPDVVVNCGALTVPGACESDPAAAMSVNVPCTLLQWLSTFDQPSATLLIHLSTDQVIQCINDVSYDVAMMWTVLNQRRSALMTLYQGTKSFYREDDPTLPVNVYGNSKVAAEEYIFHNCSNFVILRSSIIFGPKTPSPLSKSLPLQWMDDVLSKGQEALFFHDEFRCPVYVKDVVNIIQILTHTWLSDGKQTQLVLNVGGPNRLSRAQMAETVARVRGYNAALIKPVSASSIDRGVKSPADISMDISKLIQTLDFTPTSFEDAVKLTFDTSKC